MEHRKILAVRSEVDVRVVSYILTTEGERHLLKSMPNFLLLYKRCSPSGLAITVSDSWERV
jgi:hypothetical protein